MPNNEIGAAVEELKAFIKEEKDISSEVSLIFTHSSSFQKFTSAPLLLPCNLPCSPAPQVSHLSDKQFRRIREDTEALAQLVSVLATGVQHNKARLDRLKLEAGQELVNAEIAVSRRDFRSPR